MTTRRDRPESRIAKIEENKGEVSPPAVPARVSAYISGQREVVDSLKRIIRHARAEGIIEGESAFRAALGQAFGEVVREDREGSKKDERPLAPDWSDKML